MKYKYWFLLLILISLSLFLFFDNNHLNNTSKNIVYGMDSADNLLVYEEPEGQRWGEVDENVTYLKAVDLVDGGKIVTGSMTIDTTGFQVLSLNGVSYMVPEDYTWGDLYYVLDNQKDALQNQGEKK